MCLLNVYGMSTVFPFVHACMHACVCVVDGGGGGLSGVSACPCD